MHLLQLTAPLHVGGSIGSLTPGEWVMQNQNAFELALMADRGTATLKPYICSKNPDSCEVLIMRSGAIGDLLFLGPAIRAYKKQFPDVRVHLCCRKEHWGLFANTDMVETLIQYPIPVGVAETYWDVISLEDVMELAHDTHATDAFAKALEVTVEDYRPSYVVMDEEKSIAQNWIPSPARNRVGIQVTASTRNRNYPLEQWATVLKELHRRGWEIFLFGLPGQIPNMPPDLRLTGIHDMSNKGLTFRETAALLSLCHAFVGIDSSLLHLCHALDVPAIGLYGPFSWETRTSKAPLTRALSGEGECANCRWHAKNGQHFPLNTCRSTQVCSVLASIPAERIIAKVDAIKP